jgi:hypothetical protein
MADIGASQSADDDGQAIPVSKLGKVTLRRQSTENSPDGQA